MGPVSRPQRKHDNNESVIMIDIPKEQNQDAKGELEEFKKMIADLKPAQKDMSMEDKEKHKQEKMALALMMAKFDAVMNLTLVRNLTQLTYIISPARHILRERGAT